MTDQIREQLSALLDGELPKDEMGLLVRRLEKDATLRRAFGSYALIGETLRAPGGRIASTDFAARVSATIDAADEVAAAAPASLALPHATAGAIGRNAGAAANVHDRRFWQRPVVRTALAASAAAVAVVVFRPETTPLAQNTALPAAIGMSTASPTPAQSQRLASFMVAHSQYSTPIVRRNVLSSLLAADPGITRVSFEMGEAP